MPSVDSVRQLLQMAWSLVGLVHQHAFPLCGDIVLRLSEQWGPLKTVLRVAGPSALTYALEMVLVYIGAQMVILVARMFSSTLYRLLRFVLGVFIIATGVSLGLYFYFTSTKSGQQQRLTGGKFWADQALALASQLAPLWGTQAGAGAQSTRNPPPPNFQYQPPGY
ncbi:hypothetical protein GGF46_000550 [Coemansia sp. RSA 552]|nr:hypothetical protein GGF46_000550 [Coemansia sp. RSA 552]